MKTQLLNRLRRTHAWRLLPVLLAVSGCAPEEETNSNPAAENNIADTYLSFEEFEAKTYQEPDTGVYIVDGDFPIENIDKLREFWEHLQQPTALAVFNYNGADQIWSKSQQLNVSYCINKAAFGVYYGVVVDAMRKAAADWAQVANVQYMHAAAFDNSCTNANNNVTFDVQIATGQPYLARAFLPSYGRSVRQVVIDTSSFNNPGGGKYTLAGILRHELGHTLGFRHEHTRPEAAKCFEDNNWRGVTSYDPYSVMHYPQCNGANTTGDLNLTANDKVGVSLLYGRRNGGLENLSYYKQTSSSTVSSGAQPARAVDGDPDGRLVHNTTALTQPELQPWWQVDLGTVRPVGEVLLDNFILPDSTRANNFDVSWSANGTDFTKLTYTGELNGRQSFHINEAARYVKVQLKQTTLRQLALAEVEVLRARNLAQESLLTATQSSTNLGATATRAADGNRNGAFTSASVTLTNAEASPWWQAELKGNFSISDVVLYKRTDCCSNGLSNFKIRTSVDGTNWTDVPFPGTAANIQSIAVNKVAKFIRVQLVDNGTMRPLSLAEVEIMSARNLAHGKTATQSSDQLATTASRAVDGITDGRLGSQSVSATANELTPWWQVDLGKISPVTEVNIYTETQCCPLAGYKVMVSPDGSAWTQYSMVGGSFSRQNVVINDQIRFVKVQLDNTGTPRALMLAEVEVIGDQPTAPVSLVPVHRAYNVTSRHFYTTGLAEAQQVGLEVEGYFQLGAMPQDAQWLPLYRCAKPGATQFHLYTLDPGCEGWMSEGILGYISTVPQLGSKPLYRLFHAMTQDHMYTIAASERASSLAAGGWADEGITGYVF